MRTYAQGRSSFFRSSLLAVWYPRIETLTLLLNPGRSEMFATGKAGAFSAQVPASQTWPIHHMNPSRPMNCFLSRDSFNISHRRSDTRVRRDFDHKRVQGMKGRDDLLPLSLFCDDRRIPLIREVLLQHAAAFGD